MTDKMLIDKSVVEQTIEAMRRAGEQRGSTASEFNAIEALRAALDQTQVEQEPPTDVKIKMLIPDSDEWKYGVGLA